ncbi:MULTISPECIES: TrkA family potassium uptake protein [Paenibacillus]|uniref:TrkA family potassium uptake protein n=1 Tax=Paenibacillus violae TaxID=3077234 RepID=A0ABU3RFQ8_9BACL|nr:MULTISPECIES: TrkA family potassium uptake protein [Paenibacillus]MDU0203104.1 TrkA family potassium uptake protein [Paenibacillus sp. PFR10]MEC0267188.1 TrkA family potassium uptake protein [Paenibacillus anseongense]
MKKTQYVVVGLGRFGASISKELIKLGNEVLGIDKDEEAVDEMSHELTHTVVADATDEDVLKSLGVRNFDCAVVAIGDDIQSSILTAIVLKDLGVKKVVAKALSELHGKVLQKLGVDRVIYPERDMGIRVAHQLNSPNLLDYIEISKDYTIAELSVPKRLCGLTIKQLDPRAKYGCSVVAVNKQTGVIIAPTATDVVNENDVMVIIGTNDQIEEFESEVIR